MERSAATATVFGRTSELGEIARFLDEVPDGPVALMLVGDAGIGKTTLWGAGIEGAAERGWCVLRAQASASETTMTFAALGDLLDPVIDEVADEIPQVQRSALRAALLRGDPEDEAVDQRAVGLGVLGCLRALARSGPVVVAVDDVQWLDPSSATVLRFVVRRLVDVPIGVLTSARLEAGDGDPLELRRAMREGRSERVVVRSLPSDDLGQLIRDRLGANLPRPVTERIHVAAGGNPFFALEIARELRRSSAPTIGETLPVPSDVRDLLVGRVSALSGPARELLLTIACAARPTEALVTASSAVGSPVEGLLAEAVDAGLVSLDADRIRFTHPLLASAVSTAASAQQRRATHRSLAAHVDDPEERARHLALASAGPDAAVADALEQAAETVAARGAPQSAAELALLARASTPASDVSASIRRAFLAASQLFDAGDDAGARAVLEDALSIAPSDDARAELLYRLASIGWMDMRRVRELCERALLHAHGDPGIAAALHDHLAWVGIYRGDLLGASRHANQAMELVTADVDASIKADVAATLGMLAFLQGDPAETSMAEAERLHDESTSGRTGRQTVFTAAPTCHGLQLLWAGQLDAARDVLEAELHAYEARGRYIVRDEVLGYLAELECRAGNWERAERYAAEGYDIDVEAGRSSSKGHQLFPRALVAALQGRTDDARADAELGLELCLADEDRLDANSHRWVLGFLALSQGDPAGAIRCFEPVIDFLDSLGAPEPGIIPCIPDAIEALVALGRADEADILQRRLAEQGASRDRPWARATALRCRGLLLAHRGDVAAAIASLEEALEEHTLVPQPFDRARTVLVKGEVERRGKQKKAARSSLQEALAAFEHLGTPPWSARARNALDRIGGRPPTPLHLTGTERQVAELVATGKTNAEVAGELFMSVDTVRSNLRRIYGKLQVRHRTELAARLHELDAVPPADQ
jgi:DNA-binding CsgD family transcriptional regulator